MINRKDFRIPKMFLLIMSVVYGVTTIVLGVKALFVPAIVMAFNTLMLVLEYRDYVEPFDPSTVGLQSTPMSSYSNYNNQVNNPYNVTSDSWQEFNSTEPSNVTPVRKSKKRLLLGVPAILLIIVAITLSVNTQPVNNDSIVDGNYTDSENESLETKIDDNSTPDDATMGEKNAVNAAKNYVTIMAFSYDGLIHQLEFEGYSQSEATYGADNCNADWNEMALKSANNYLDTMAFSESGLIKQLEFDKYTTEQATKAVQNCGADWKEQAVKSAKNYLNTLTFSKQGLIDQLKFDGFTTEQATYGAEQNGY